MRKISIRQMAAIKRTAMNVSSLVTKRNNLQTKVKSLVEELAMINAQIESYDAGTKVLTGGIGSEFLVKKEYVTTTTNTPEGPKEVKMAKYVPNEEYVHLAADGKYYELVDPACSSVNPCEAEVATVEEETSEDETASDETALNS